MNKETLELVIDILYLASRAESNPVLKKNLINCVSGVFVNEIEKDIPNQLTTWEISTGENEGKLACVKLVRNRLGLDLMTIKKLVESEFDRLGKKFRNYS